MTTQPPVEDKYSQRYAAGTVVFREGDAGGEMYVIQAGRVELTRRLGGQDKVIAILPPGEFFGEMAVVSGRPRSATATVIEDAQMLALDSKTFDAMLRNNSEIAIRLIRKLAARLEQANQQIESLLMRNTNHRVVQALRGLAAARGKPEGAGVRVHATTAELAKQLASSVEEVDAAIERLARVGLVEPGPESQSFLVAEDGRLEDFLEFQEIKQKYGR